MRYAIIIDGTVVNVIEAEAGFASTYAAELGGTAVATDVGCPGYAYADGTFTPPSVVAPVPPVVTRAQAKAALILSGRIDDVEPALEAIPDALQRALALNDWRERLTFERYHPLVLQMGAALELDLDDLFRTAATL